MAGKSRLQASVKSYGIYEAWDGSVPQVRDFTDRIPARVGIEFGYVLHITGGRGERIDFRIDHPPFDDAKGRRAPPFTGTIHIKTNDYDVFLGDTIWEPWQDKCGLWTLTTWHEGRELHSRCFTIHAPVEDETA